MKRPSQVTSSSKRNNSLYFHSLFFLTSFLQPLSSFFFFPPSIFNLPLPIRISRDSPLELFLSLSCRAVPTSPGPAALLSPSGDGPAPGPGPGEQEPDTLLALTTQLSVEGSATWTVCVKQGRGSLCLPGFVCYLGAKTVQLANS